MAVAKKQAEPEGLTPDMIETVATIAEDVLGNIRTGEVPGPVNLQALWIDVAKIVVKGQTNAARFCGGPGPEVDQADRIRAQYKHIADDAAGVADLVVDAFKARAAKLAEDTAGLAYFDPDADEEAEG